MAENLLWTTNYPTKFVRKDFTTLQKNLTTNASKRNNISEILYRNLEPGVILGHIKGSNHGKCTFCAYCIKPLFRSKVKTTY